MKAISVGKIIEAKYEEEDIWMTKEVTSPYGVNLWRSISVLWKEFKGNTKIKVNNALSRRSQPSVEPMENYRRIFDWWRVELYLQKTTQLNDWEVLRVAKFFGTIDHFSGIQHSDDEIRWKDSDRQI